MRTKLELIRERGVLKVGTTGDYMPMSFLDPEMGRYFGIDAELAEDLAEALGSAESPSPMIAKKRR